MVLPSFFAGVFLKNVTPLSLRAVSRPAAAHHPTAQLFWLERLRQFTKIDVSLVRIKIEMESVDSHYCAKSLLHTLSFSLIYTTTF
jgi:hypothetical protein